MANYQLEEKYVVFQLGKEEFALSVECVHSIEKLGEVTEVPNAPEYMKGITNLRGKILPIVDLKSLLSIQSPGKAEQFIVVTIDEKLIGLIIDEAKEVIDLPVQQFESLQLQKENFDREIMIANWNGRYFIHLNIEQLLFKWVIQTSC